MAFPQTVQDEWSEIMGMIGTPAYEPSGESKDLLNLIYGRAKASLEPVSFESSPYSRLLGATAAEATQAGIRQFQARTGGVGTAASAATAALLRAQGGTNVARGLLEGQILERQERRAELGQSLDFIAGERGIQAQLASQAFGVKANLLTGMYGRRESREARKWQSGESAAQRQWEGEQAAFQAQMAANLAEAGAGYAREARREARREPRLGEKGFKAVWD